MKSPDKVINHIVNWLKEYLEKSKLNGFIIGVSGGIDSALTSTLCAKTGYPVKCLEMPIHQNKMQNSNSSIQVNWLKSEFPNVTSDEINLSNVFDQFIELSTDTSNELTNLALANTRARFLNSLGVSDVVSINLSKTSDSLTSLDVTLEKFDFSQLI